QIAAAQISTNPQGPALSTPVFNRRHLLFDGDWVNVPPTLAAALPPRELKLDQGKENAGLAEGWRCWWVRGVDLLGWVSEPSSPVVRKIEDTALPPPPSLLWGEYVQPELTALQGPTTPQSTFARDWVMSNPNTRAFIVSWAWTPELHEQCPD